jgi:pimeloyl-ACP methyl ester carboxylesterase
VPDLRIDVDGATLAASYSPAGDTVVVALHGASAGVRDHQLYRYLHRVLPPAGIGVVTFDRRGEGDSSGDPSVGQFELQARDGLGVAAATGARRIGLWGFSQGGWVAPLAATMSDDVAFLALIASTGVSPHEQMLFANAEQLRRAGYGPEAVARAQALRRALHAWTLEPDPAAGESLRLDLLAAETEPWWELTYLPTDLPDEAERQEWAAEMTFDPRPVFNRVKVPVLLFYGADDGWTPVDASVEAWSAAIDERAETVVLPDASHELTLPDGSLHPSYEERLVEWCRRMADA